MTESIPLENFKCDHLFLLMGRNPLPNWVAARLLLRPGGQLYLLHSDGPDGTGHVAKSLSRFMLGRRQAAQPIFIPLQDESDPAEIRRCLGPHVRAITSGRVGLNYTGGTKVMAVHAYRALGNCLQLGLPEPVFSYLDGRHLKLIIDPQGSFPNTRSYTVALAPEARLTVADLLALHDYGPERFWVDARAEPVFGAMMALHRRSQSHDAWRRWLVTNLHPKERQNAFKSNTELAKVELPAAGELAEVTRALGSGHLRPGVTLQEAADAWGFGKVKDLAEWLDGKWLEHHVLVAFRQSAGLGALSDFGRALEARPLSSDGKAKGAAEKFDADVVAIRGYQLFYVSCYTGAVRATAKHKLLEALARARQLGGDEARVGLVCGYADFRSLEREVSNIWGVEGQFRVFGIDDWDRLDTELLKWLQQVGG